MNTLEELLADYENLRTGEAEVNTARRDKLVRQVRADYARLLNDMRKIVETAQTQGTMMQANATLRMIGQRAACAVRAASPPAASAAD